MSSKRRQNVRFYSTKTFRLLCMMIFTFSLFIIEIVVGNITNSLALLADAFHMLSDLIALAIGLLVVRIAKRRSDINTFGWARAEVVGANINTVFLLALCLTIIFDTIKRYISPEVIVNPTLLLIVGSTGLGINIIGLFLFQGYHGHSHGDGAHGHSHDKEAHGHSHDKEAHGHSHDKEAHGHSHDKEAHAHSHDKEAHGHSHDKEAHAHSHDEEAHGHSHDKKAHGHSYDEQAHGHSHDITDKSKSAHSPKTSIEIKEDTNKPDKNNTTTTMYSNDIEPLEIIIGSSEFKRHSLRALDEAIVDCTTHADDSSQSEHDRSSDLDTVDSSTKSPKQKKASSMNMHGLFLHVLADALGSVVVIISALIIKFVPHDPNDHKHWTVYVDPTLSVIIVIIISISTIPLLKETTYVLLQTVPKNIEVVSIKKRLLDEVPEIDGIHELHIWRLTSNAIIATAHLHRRSLTDYMAVASKVRGFFHRIGIHSTTIQYEQQDDETQDYLINNNKESDGSKLTQIDCLLSCPDEACGTKTCCTKDSIRTDGMLNTNNNNRAQNKSTNALEVCIEMTGKQSLTHTTNDETRIGAANNGFIPEKF